MEIRQESRASSQKLVLFQYDLPRIGFALRELALKLAFPECRPLRTFRELALICRFDFSPRWTDGLNALETLRAYIWACVAARQVLR
jgi:hypothetical protein